VGPRQAVCDTAVAAVAAAQAAAAAAATAAAAAAATATAAAAAAAAAVAVASCIYAYNTGMWHMRIVFAESVTRSCRQAGRATVAPAIRRNLANSGSRPGALRVTGRSPAGAAGSHASMVNRNHSRRPGPRLPPVPVH
jgi:hypothetical protein